MVAAIVSGALTLGTTAYMVLLARLFGFLPTWSESYYALGKAKWAFLLWAWFMAGGVITIFITTPAHPSKVFLLISSIFLIALGIAGDYRNDSTSYAHVTGAIGSIVGGLGALGFYFHNYYALVAIAVAAAIFEIPKVYKATGNKVYWQEMVALYGILVGITYSTIKLIL